LRYKVSVVFIISVMLILLARVYFLSIKSNTYYEELSKQNYIRRIYEEPPRGIIEDRNGVALAVNKLGFSISLKPHLTHSNQGKDLLKICSFVSKEFPSYDLKHLLRTYKKLDSPYNHDYIKIIPYVPYKKLFLKYDTFLGFDDIKIKPSLKRFYPFGKIGAHVVGYVGRASKSDEANNDIAKYTGIVGKNGLEKYYNELLQGKLGYKDVKVNALNKDIGILDYQPTKNNNNLKTTIDIRLQKYIEREFKAKGGAVIVMNANTGGILAAASFPEFDNNIFVDGISTKQWQKLRNDFNHPFTNKLTNGLYPPGSVIKMGVATSFLENGLPLDYHIYCKGYIKVGNRYFRCWKKNGHGRVGFRKALRESCDVFFYDGSLEVGINKISKTLATFGFGKKTGVDQVDEFIGNNPNKVWKKEKYHRPWYIGETVISAIGQGYTLVTPMQIARYTAGIATNKLPRPHFSILDYAKPKNLNIPKKDLKLIQEGMYDVANAVHGTAFSRNHSKIIIAAKTGTAQVVGIPQSEKKRMHEYQLEYYHKSHAWFTSYGPYKNPKYVVTVIVEHGGHGGVAAGNLVSKIYNKLYYLGYIKKRR